MHRLISRVLSTKATLGRRRKPRWVGVVESLESRQLLTTAVAGVDYSLTGFSWANPAHITYSIASDGVYWDHGTNDLNAVMDAKLGAGVWERDIALDLASWEAVANINISLVSDSNNPLNTIGLSQGDPRFGDIRFGGYEFPNDTSTLANTYFPPPNGSTEAGDVEVNTSMNYNTGSGYDFFSVLLHETGHSLGLDHATVPTSVMYYQYGGVRTGLAPGDIAGIQAIYGARVADSYTAAGQGLGFGSAINATPVLNAQGQGAVTGVSLATIGATEYYKVVAPAAASGAFQVTAAASNVSMLSPKVTLYDSSGNVIQTQSNANAWSNDISVGGSSVVPGATYYVAVTGATSDAFSVGAYNLKLSFSGISAPITSTPTGSGSGSISGSGSNSGSGSTGGSGSSSGSGTSSPIGPAPTSNPPPSTPSIAPDRFESNNTISTATQLGYVTQTIVGNLNLNTASDVDIFAFRNTRAGVYAITAYGTSVKVVDAYGHVLAAGNGSLSVRIARARTTLYVEMSSTNQAPLPDYGLSIAMARTPARTSRAVRPAVVSNDAVMSPAVSETVHPKGHPAFAAWYAAHHRGR